MAKATVNGVETHYEVRGEGTPVIFVHGGFGGPGTTLVPQPNIVASVLTDGVRLVTYDRRCAGQSEYMLAEYRLEDLAADAAALLDHLGIERSIVIGSSMGGMVAQQYALSYPQRVSALALLNTGADLMSETTWGRQLTAVVEQARAGGDRALFESRKEQLRDPQPPAGMAVPERTPEQEARLRQMREATREALAKASDEELFTWSTGAVRNQGAFIGYDFAPRLGELRMPVCIIHGNADTTVPFDYGKALHAAIPQSEFHEIDGAAHGILAYEPAQKALRDWVGRVARPD